MPMNKNLPSFGSPSFFCLTPMSPRSLLILWCLIKEARLILCVFCHAINKFSLFVFIALCCNFLQLLYRVSSPSKLLENGRKRSGSCGEDQQVHQGTNLDGDGQGTEDIEDHQNKMFVLRSLHSLRYCQVIWVHIRRDSLLLTWDLSWFCSMAWW